MHVKPRPFGRAAAFPRERVAPRLAAQEAAMIFRLIYSSKAAPELAAADLEDMLKESRVRNRARGITGVLVFVDGVFLQILEGEEKNVLDLMRTIALDPRHSDIKVFHEEECKERAFADWNMAFLNPGAADVAHWAELEGATTFEEILASVEREPHRLPGMVINMLKLIG
jgi:hypothetical protein